jgi:hypothetical protein
MRHRAERDRYGRRIKRRRRALFWVWLLPLVGGALWLALVGSYSHQSRTDESDDAVVATQRFVREYLGPGTQTRFSSRAWTKVNRDGDHYIVTGWVDAEKRDGGNSTVFEFVCTVFRNIDGDWYNQDLDIHPQ